MNYLDIYYRALIDYRKNTGDFRDCVNQRLSVAKTDAKNDVLTITRKICTVDTDWVEAIEEGLVHVEKAIREERQFIRSNGEVIDIEKVKNVSKDSVEHLARHSNLITRYEEGEDVIPDRLYTVERLSDYAVYENRFLYMLLCYLRDFITLRYNKILELEHTYNGSMAMNKTIAMTKRNLSFEIKVQEERKDDYYLKKQSESKDIIVRIGNQLKLVLAFLATPLMQEVSKVAMLKPPITKTNVLRMNHNFRGALALYEFVSAYDKPGYTVEEKTGTQSPFRMDVADEMAEIVMLASFLTYEHGLNLKGELQLEYEEEEKRRREEEKRRLLEQLKALRHRIRESGESPEEYMLMLEKTNRLLQEDRERLFQVQQEMEILKNDIASLERDKKSLTEEVASLNGKIDTLVAEHASEIERLNEDHRVEIENINNENEAEKARITEEYEGQLESQKNDYEGKLDEQKNDYEERLDSLKTAMREEEDDHKRRLGAVENEKDRVVESIRAMWQAEVHSLKDVCDGKDKEIAGLNEQAEELENRRRVSEARLTAIRKEHGLIGETEDFTSQRSFEEIEHQLDVFIAFFKKQWGKTKKAIRKNAFKEMKESIKAEKAAKKAKKSGVPVEDDPKAEETAQNSGEADEKESTVTFEKPLTMVYLNGVDRKNDKLNMEADNTEAEAKVEAEAEADTEAVADDVNEAVADDVNEAVTENENEAKAAAEAEVENATEGAENDTEAMTEDEPQDENRTEE